MAKLYFYYSAMNAGKTTTLLQSAHNYRERGMRVLILTPRLDDRSGNGMVASRIGLSAQGAGFGREDDLEQRVRADIAARDAHHHLLEQTGEKMKIQAPRMAVLALALFSTGTAPPLRADSCGAASSYTLPVCFSRLMREVMLVARPK